MANGAHYFLHRTLALALALALTLALALALSRRALLPVWQAQPGGEGRAAGVGIRRHLPQLHRRRAEGYPYPYPYPLYPYPYPYPSP